MGAHKLSTAWSQPRTAVRDDGNGSHSGFVKVDLDKNDVQVLHVLNVVVGWTEHLSCPSHTDRSGSQMYLFRLASRTYLHQATPLLGFGDARMVCRPSVLGPCLLLLTWLAGPVSAEHAPWERSLHRNGSTMLISKGESTRNCFSAWLIAHSVCFVPLWRKLCHTVRRCVVCPRCQLTKQCCFGTGRWLARCSSGVPWLLVSALWAAGQKRATLVYMQVIPPFQSACPRSSKRVFGSNTRAASVSQGYTNDTWLGRARIIVGVSWSQSPSG